MSSKAISTKYQCNPAKIPLDRNPYIQVDIDRLIGWMKAEIEMMDGLLKNPEGTILEDAPRLTVSIEDAKDTYEGLLGMIEANSFK